MLLNFMWQVYKIGRRAKWFDLKSFWSSGALISMIIYTWKYVYSIHNINWMKLYSKVILWNNVIVSICNYNRKLSSLETNQTFVDS